jgi:hypothetical protein
MQLVCRQQVSVDGRIHLHSSFFVSVVLFCCMYIIGVLCLTFLRFVSLGLFEILCLVVEKGWSHSDWIKGVHSMLFEFFWCDINFSDTIAIFLRNSKGQSDHIVLFLCQYNINQYIACLVIVSTMWLLMLLIQFSSV